MNRLFLLLGLSVFTNSLTPATNPSPLDQYKQSTASGHNTHLPTHLSDDQIPNKTFQEYILDRGGFQGVEEQEEIDDGLSDLEWGGIITGITVGTLLLGSLTLKSYRWHKKRKAKRQAKRQAQKKDIKDWENQMDDLVKKSKQDSKATFIKNHNRIPARKMVAPSAPPASTPKWNPDLRGSLLNLSEEARKIQEQGDRDFQKMKSQLTKNREEYQKRLAEKLKKRDVECKMLKNQKNQKPPTKRP